MEWCRPVAPTVARTSTIGSSTRHLLSALCASWTAWDTSAQRPPATGQQGLERHVVT